MSSDKHEKKHRRKKVVPYDDDSDTKYNKTTNYQYYENPAYADIDLEKQNNKADDNVNKFRGVAEKAQYHSNAINLITNVKQGASKWRQYVTSKRMRQKRAESATSDLAAADRAATPGGDAGTGVDRRCTGGQGLADIEEDFISDSKSTSRQMVVASNRTLLQYFARLGGSENFEECIDLDFVESLFKNGARIDCTDKYGQTVFHEVARAWHIDVAKFLIENGGDPNVTDAYGRTPLHVASAVDYAEMVKFLIENGANKEARTKGEEQTPVHFAARNDACQSLKQLVKSGCQYKLVRDYKKRTPIQVAAELDRSESAALLLELGSPVGVQDDSGQPCIVWMITKMAPVAKEALNQFHVTDRANRKQYYFLNHLEPKPPQLHKRLSATPQEKEDLEKKTHAQTALEVITSYKQFDLVTHPAVKRLIHVKWKRFGQLGAWSNLIFNFVFICLWTALGVHPDWNERYKYTFPEDTWRIILWIAAIALTLYQIVTEILEYKNSRKKHLAWKEWREKELDRDKNFCHQRWPEELEYIIQEEQELDKAAPQYASDWWNIFDWVCYVLLLSCIVTHIADVALPTHSVLLAHAHIRIMSVNIILLWLRLMKNARAFSLLGPFIAMLGHILNDVFKFVFLFLEFYIPYLSAFWMIHGGVNTMDKYLVNPPTDNTTVTQVAIPGYETFGGVLFSVFRLTLVDDYPYDEMKSVDPIMTDILVGTWFALSAILCLNLFIALMSDTFQRVYDNAHANAVMQKAMTIMNLQDNMSNKRRFKFMSHIHETCAPLQEYYDDDMASDTGADLKKVAFQVKDELEEIKEWFHAKFGPVDSMLEPDSKKILGNNQSVTVDVLENEVDVLRGELRDISTTQQEFQERYTRDMSALKGLLEQILINQGGGGGGGRRTREEEPVYDDAYAPVRDDEGRRSRRKEKKRKGKPRRTEAVDEFGVPETGTPGGVQGLGLDPMIEVRPMGHTAAEPPPPDIGGMGLQDTTDA